MNLSAVMVCHHDPRLVVLFILISVLAAFAARELVAITAHDAQHGLCKTPKEQ